VAELAVTAMGPDRPGIVAAVAGVLRHHGGNVEDSAMTILGGRFSLVLLVDVDAGADELRTALTAATAHLGLHLTVEDAGDTADSAAPTHLLSVYGADQPGILAGVSAALAEVGANVTDLSTRLLGADNSPVWSMVVEFATDDAAAVAAAVQAVADRLGVDHTLRALDAATY
jgi:glycine cleavage system transcriptional repressor